MRLMYGLIALLLAGSSMACAEPTGFLNKKINTAENGTRRYVVYVPHDYTPDQAWPLILFLHGAGERGDDGLKQTQVGLGEAIRRNPERFPAIVVMPQCPEDKFWTVAIPDIEAALAQTTSEYNIDPSRMYLTGLSMGGYMTWIWGATQTERFAALMPICGGGILLDMMFYVKTPMEDTFGTIPERVANLAKVPIWAFHGAKDEVVPVARSRQMVEAVKKAGGDVKYTEYPEVGHDAWEPAYADADAITWLLNQKK